MSNFILCQVDGWVLDIYRGKLQRHGYFPHTQIVDVVIVIVVVVVVVDLIDVKADVVIT